MTEIRSTGVIALGANLDFDGSSSRQTLQSCISRFREWSLNVRRISRFFITPCFPKGAGPDYINAAVLVSTPLTAKEVLPALHDIEATFGRERDARWGARSLDLDLIFFDDELLPSAQIFYDWMRLSVQEQMRKSPKELILPHPRVQDRSFVLAPVADVAPDWVHPALGLSVVDMLAARPAEERAEICAL